MTYIHSFDDALWLTHSRYYNQWVGSLPFAPHVYWNVVTDDDVIPVCTYGYKTLKSAQQQIKKYLSDIKEYRLIHVESKEEYAVDRRNTMRMLNRSLSDTWSSLDHIG